MSAFGFSSDLVCQENVPSDIEVSQSISPVPISKIVESAGVLPSEYDLYGNVKCKVSLGVRDRLAAEEDGHYVVVTGINPTPLGNPSVFYFEFCLLLT